MSWQEYLFWETVLKFVVFTPMVCALIWFVVFIYKDMKGE